VTPEFGTLSKAVQRCCENPSQPPSYTSPRRRWLITTQSHSLCCRQPQALQPHQQRFGYGQTRTSNFTSLYKCQGLAQTGSTFLYRPDMLHVGCFVIRSLAFKPFWQAVTLSISAWQVRMRAMLSLAHGSSANNQYALYLCVEDPTCLISGLPAVAILTAVASQATARTTVPMALGQHNLPGIQGTYHGVQLGCRGLFS